MSLFVKVVDDEVTQVWDTPPPEGAKRMYEVMNNLEARA